VPSLTFAAITAVGVGGVACLTGVSPTGVDVTVDAGTLGRNIVLENKCIVGSVNANRKHYEAAAAALAKADKTWLARLISRKVPLESFAEALAHGPDDVKVVIEIAS